MAIQRDKYLDQYDTTITGCYYRVNKVELRYETQPLPTGVSDDDRNNYRNEYECDIEYEVFLNSGERYSISGHSTECQSVRAPISIMTTVSGKDSLVAAAYDFLKTGELSGGIDI